MKLRRADNARAIQQLEALEATRKEAKHAPSSPDATAPQVTQADAPPLYTYDPWERANRFIYRFNARFDEKPVRAVADEYRRIPLLIRTGVHNFLGNLAEIPTVVNDVLQWKIQERYSQRGPLRHQQHHGHRAACSISQPISHRRCPPLPLARRWSTWGVHPGPFLVIPILGPSTVREGLGYLGDYGISYGINVADLYRGTQGYAVGVVNAVDTRANTNFRYYQTGFTVRIREHPLLVCAQDPE